MSLFCKVSTATSVSPRNFQSELSDFKEALHVTGVCVSRLNDALSHPTASNSYMAGV